jgi:hypothetical protein
MKSIGPFFSYRSILMRGEQMINAKTLPRLPKPAFLLLQLILIFAYGCSPKLTDIVIVFPTDTNPPPTAIAQEQPSATQSPASHGHIDTFRANSCF